MPTLAITNPTLADVAKRTAPDGSIDQIIEILNESNPVLEDMTPIECNDGSTHLTTIRTGLPQGTWRKLYGGVQPGKSSAAQVRDGTGMLEAYGEVDKALAEKNNNSAAFRLSEDKAFMEGMNQQCQDTIFYGNEGSSPEAFTGLAPRYNTRNVATAQSADNVIHGGGTGSSNTSIWLVGWGALAIHTLFPKGSQAGLVHRDLGEQTKQNPDGSLFQVLRSHYRWDIGLTVRDWRYAVRICNIDVTLLKNDASSGANLIDLLTDAVERVPDVGSVRYAIYCNRTIRAAIRQQSKYFKTVNLTADQIAGKRVAMWDGIPLRKTDSLISNEAAVPNT
jgi:hypothetical protein